MFICFAVPADGTRINSNERTTVSFTINMYQAGAGEEWEEEKKSQSPSHSLHHYFIGEKNCQKGSGGRNILQFPLPILIMDTWTAQRSPPIHAETPNLQKSQRHWKHNNICQEATAFAQALTSPALSPQTSVSPACLTPVLLRKGFRSPIQPNGFPTQLLLIAG